MSIGSDRYKTFTQEVKDKMAWNRGKRIVSDEEVFTVGSKYSSEMVKMRFLQDNEYKCVLCQIESWNDDYIVLELDHINGINNDHRKENLRLICPNCHSQTSNFRGRNKNKGNVKVSDEVLINALNTCGSIRSALQSVGLAAKGGNYIRAKRLRDK